MYKVLASIAFSPSIGLVLGQTVTSTLRVPRRYSSESTPLAYVPESVAKSQDEEYILHDRRQQRHQCLASYGCERQPDLKLDPATQPQAKPVRSKNYLASALGNQCIFDEARCDVSLVGRTMDALIETAF